MIRSYQGLLLTFAKFITLHELLKGPGLKVASSQMHVEVPRTHLLLITQHQLVLLLQEFPARDNCCARPSISWLVHQCDAQPVNQEFARRAIAFYLLE